MQDAVHMADGARCKRLPGFAAQQRRVELVDMDRAQLLQLDIADMGGDMVAEQFRVTLESLGTDVAFGPVAFPALDEISNCYFRRVDVLTSRIFGN